MLPSPQDPAEALSTLEFLETYLADQRAGRVRDTAAYVGRFPRVAARLQEEIEWIDADEHSAARIGGRFRTIMEIGRGGQAVVWLAEDTALHHRRVALKVFALHSGADTIRRFQRETRAALRLELPGVCPVLDAGIDADKGVAWIAMRYVRGEPFGNWLRRHRELQADGPVDWRPLVEKIAEVATICDGIHQAGIVHRDLKPSNLQITPDGQVVVLDFGIAKDLWELESRGLTATGDVIGTPSYMAPEQLAGRGRELGPHTDVYALGLILLEALGVQQSPDEPRDNSRIQARAQPSGLPSGLPRDLAIVVRTALRERPAERYPSAVEFALDLRSVLSGQPIRAAATRPWRRASHWLRRRRAHLATAILAVSLLVLAVYSMLTSQQLAYAASVHHDAQILATLGSAAEADLLATPRGLPGLETWIADAEALHYRVQAHEAHLQELQARGQRLEETAEDRELQQIRVTELNRVRGQIQSSRARLDSLEKSPASTPARARRLRWARRSIRHGEEIAGFLERRVDEVRRWHFDRQEDASLHPRLRSLVSDLRALALPRPGRLTILRTKLWCNRANQVTQTMRKSAPLWAAAIRRVADRERSPRYEGLRLTVQTGFVPLGRDPVTALEEFAHIGSGTVPTRDPDDGRLRCDAGSAMVFVLLPGGSFDMGDPGDAQTSPVHAVELDPLLFGKHEMTSGQFERLTYQVPNLIVRGAKLKDGKRMSAVHPAEHVAWRQGLEVLRRFGMTLPTEAQWEYACRGRPGADHATLPLEPRANLADRHAARFEDGTFRHVRDLDDGHWFHAPVGSFAPNSFGIHDLLGNVAEWCLDSHAPYSSPVEDRTGRRAAHTSGARIVRGGSFRSTESQARCWVRDARAPNTADCEIGIRAVRNLEPAPEGGG